MRESPSDPLGWVYRAIKDFGFPAVVAGFLLWDGPREREAFAAALKANAAAMERLAAEVHANTTKDEEIRGIAKVVCPLCPLPPGPAVKVRHRRPIMPPPEDPSPVVP